MKRTIPYLVAFAAFGASPALFAEDGTSPYVIDETKKTVTVTGGLKESDTRVQITPSNDGTYNDYTVILKSGGSNITGDMFGASRTIKSLDGTGTMGTASTSVETRWNLFGTLTIDINSATSADAITSTDTNKFYFNLSTINIKNTAETKDTFANINVGKELRMNTNGDTEESRLNIGTNADITGESIVMARGVGGIAVGAQKIVRAADTNFTLMGTNSFELKSGNAENITTLSAKDVTFENSTTLSIANYASFTANSLKFSTTSSATVGSNSSLSTNSATFNDGTSLTIGEDSTFTTNALTLKGSVTIGANSTFNVETISAHNTSNIESSGNINFTAETKSISLQNFTMDGGSLNAKNIIGGTAGRVSFHGTNALNGGTFELKGGFQASAGSTVTIGSGMGDIILHDNPASDSNYEGRVFLNGGGKIVLNKADAFTRVDKDKNETAANLLIVGNNNKLEVNAANKFKELYYSGSGEVTFILSETKTNTLAFNSFSLYNADSILLNIVNFQDDMIFFGLKDNVLERIEITATTIDGVTLTTKDLEFVAGNYTDGTSGYWLNAKGVSVPEPAEWAAILGAFTLGLAIYRKRK